MKSKKLESTLFPKEMISDLDTGKFPIIGIGASAGGYMPVVEWSVNGLLNNQEMAAGLIIINKKNES